MPVKRKRTSERAVNANLAKVAKAIKAEAKQIKGRQAAARAALAKSGGKFDKTIEIIIDKKNKAEPRRVTITFLPWAEYADPAHSTGLTNEGYESIMNSDCIPGDDVEIEVE